ncbi:MAG: S-methyl-5'-thioadenosine phosphorylase [Vicinamibacteria bacterium]|nr:S-methyl-5'-thioadenosine phosphorylase [Vicinamibacteria bacterium]
MDTRADYGIIGGTGLYDMDGLTDIHEAAVDTPFGPPSDRLLLGTLDGKRVAFLPRHGRGHRILPSELNSRANIFALKAIGVQWILSVSAVGSLKEAYAPQHIVIPDQLVDRTTRRDATFFGRGIVAHVAFAHPFCMKLSRVLAEACAEAGATHHVGGSYVCIEGPQFSTRAESELYRAWGLDLVGMTNLPEARLAREAEMCYATLAMVTDYDCWHPEHDSVTVEQILTNLGKNAAMARAVLRAALRRLPFERDCECAAALRYALVTAPDLVPERVKNELGPIIGRYMQ